MDNKKNDNIIENKDKNKIYLKELKDKLMKDYKETKYIIEKNYEKKLHNDISLIINYEFDEDEYINIVHNTRLYTELASYIIKDFVLKIINITNRYLSEKHNINNFALRKRNDITEYDNFMNKLNNLKGTKDEELIKWISLEFLDKVEFIESTLLIDCIDKFLRVEKITTNLENKLEQYISVEDYDIVEVIQLFYDFKDKLSKNNFIGDKNKLNKVMLKVLSKDNYNWIPEENKIEKKVHYRHEKKKITETNTYMVNYEFEEYDSEDFGEDDDFSKRIIFHKGENLNEY